LKKLMIVSVAVITLIALSVLPSFGCRQEVAAPEEMVDMTFVTPRGTLEVMDDYNLWIADEMGYFEEMGINLIMEPGPADALASVKFIAEGRAEVGYPSPGVLAAGIDAGMDVVMAYEMMATQVFDFAIRPDGDVQTVQDIEGKTISIGFAGWEVIVDPMLVEVGVDPATVDYIVAGDLWGQAVVEGEADVALTWRGLRAQWDAVGLGLDYIIGEEFSDMPANGYCVSTADLEDPEARQLLENFMKATSMGIHFTRINPRAAAQVTYNLFPAVREQMEPELALASMKQLHDGYTYGERMGEGYGWFPEDGWQEYLDIIYELGQTERHLTLEETIYTGLIEEANNFDRDRVEADAEAFELDEVWSNVEVVGEW